VALLSSQHGAAARQCGSPPQCCCQLGRRVTAAVVGDSLAATSLVVRCGLLLLHLCASVEAWRASHSLVLLLLLLVQWSLLSVLFVLVLLLRRPDGHSFNTNNR